jgi:hypothetical protein
MRRESAIPNISIAHVQRDGKWAWLGSVFMLVYLSIPASASQVTVGQGQMVRLKLQNVLTTENVVKGDPIDFEVAEDVVVATHVVIHKGDPARGKVIAVKGAGKRNAKDASVTFQFESVRSVDNQVINLRKTPDRRKKGESKENEIEANEPLPGYAERRVGAEKGKEYIAYVDVTATVSVPDTPVTLPPIPAVPPAQPPPSNPQVAPPVSPVSPPAPPAANPPLSEEPAKVDFDSNPAGADILIDGALVGNAPVKLPVAAGRHLIQLRIGGYNIWTRQMRVEPGSYPSIRATLEKQ